MCLLSDWNSSMFKKTIHMTYLSMFFTTVYHSFKILTHLGLFCMPIRVRDNKVLRN